MLQTLCDHKLHAKLNKCEFWLDQVVFLGHVVLAEGVSVHPKNTEAIVKWERPTIVIEVCSFLGVASYYRQFVEGFLKIALQLTSLTRKNVKFEWRDECGHSFQELKKKLVTAPILTLPTSSVEFKIYCDTSHQGLGCVLM